MVIRHDAQAFASLDQLAARIAAGATRRLSGSIEKAGAVLKEFFSSVRPTATYTPADGSWSVSLAGKEGRETGSPLLADVLDGVEELAGKSEKRVTVAIDEFQAVIDEGGDTAEEQIRAAIQRHHHVGYVFAGSKTRLLSDMVTDPSRPFYRLGSALFLGAIPRAEFAPFLREQYARTHVAADPSAIDAILDEALDVPYNVQLLAHACWEACMAARDSGGPALPLTPELVARVRDAEALRLDPLYSQLWTSLAASQRRALLAIVRGEPELLSAAVARRYSTSVPTMQKAITALKDKQILREEAERGVARLRLEDPLLGTWVRLVVKD